MINKDATYVVNIECSITKFPLFLLEEIPFSLEIPGLLLVALFLAPVISLHGALD
jgi:hypothetical protein